MTFSRLLKITLRSLQESFGLRWYCQPREYHFNYEIVIHNPTDNLEQYKVYAPLASEFPFQNIYETHFHEKPLSIQIDQQYQNSYGIWEGEVHAHAEKTISIEYRMKIAPRKLIYHTYHKEDYDVSSSEYILFTQKDNSIDPTESRIEEINKKLLQGERKVLTILARCNDFVISKLTYGNPIPGLYSSSDALEQPMVDCGGYDTFLVALLRNAGIPARVVSGFWLGYSRIRHHMHAWVEALLPDGQWIPLDPSAEQLFRQGRAWQSGKLGFTGSDRVLLSLGNDIICDEKESIALLQHPHSSNSLIKTFARIKIMK